MKSNDIMCQPEPDKQSPFRRPCYACTYRPTSSRQCPCKSNDAPSNRPHPTAIQKNCNPYTIRLPHTSPNSTSAARNLCQPCGAFITQRQLHCCEASAAACSSPQHTLATTKCDCRPGGCIGDQGLGLRRLGLRDGLRPAGGGETLPGGERTGLSPRAGGGERPLLSTRLHTDHNTH